MLLHDPIQYGVGDRGVTNPRMPMFNGQLTGNDGGLACRPVINNFHQIGARLAVNSRHAPII